jgi:hypothetical protein
MNPPGKMLWLTEMPIATVKKSDRNLRGGCLKCLIKAVFCSRKPRFASSSFTHQFEFMLRVSEACAPRCTCPHQRTLKIENIRKTCFEVGMFGQQQVSGGNGLHLPWRTPQKSSAGPRDDEVLFPPHCCSTEFRRHLGSKKRNSCIARIAFDTWPLFRVRQDDRL